MPASRRVRPLVTPGAFTLVELLVVIAIIGILVALLLPAVQAAREAARRAQCQSNLKNVALAVLNFESANQELPAAITGRDGVALGKLDTNLNYRSNWLIDTLPYLESQALFDSFDFDQLLTGGGLSNTGAANIANIIARNTEISVLLCPSDPNNGTPYNATGAAGRDWARGNYAANVGPGQWLTAGVSTSPVAPAIFTSGRPSEAWSGSWDSMAWPKSIRGAFGPNTGVKISQIVDGTSKTMLLAEIRTGINELDWRGAWALPHAGGSTLANHGSGGDSNGPNNCDDNADDNAATIGAPFCNVPDYTPILEQECMTCIDQQGSGSSGFGWTQAAPRSLHQGGVFVAYVDGSVSFVGDDIETTGIFSRCCAAWDYLIMAADEGFRPAGIFRP